MSYTKIVEITSALLSSTFVIIFEQWFSIHIVSPILATAMAIISAAVCSIFFEVFFNYLPKQFLWLRKKVNPMAKYEGVWIQIHNATQDLAICSIEYIPKSDEYIFIGRHFNTDDYIVKFTSRNIHYDENLSGFSYLVEGQHENGEFIKCWGYVSFDHEFHSHKYISGKGSFIEIGSLLSRVDFMMMKVDKKLKKKLSDDSVRNLKQEILEAFKTAENFV